MTLPSFASVDTDAGEFFARHGWVLVDALSDHDVGVVRAAVEEISLREDVLHYYELTDTGPAMCRTENFVPVHPGLRALLTTGPMVAAAGTLLGEPAVLYKEKVNHKLPGGAGYSAHQDAPAYPFIDVHISCMVAVDDADESNGCLEVASGHHHDVLPVDDVGCIAADVAESLTWAAAPIRAGQALWFHSRTPHRSGPNSSPHPRRALYPTYNALREGDLRAAYYLAKLEQMARHTVGDGVQVSLIGDFQGRPVV